MSPCNAQRQKISTGPKCDAKRTNPRCGQRVVTNPSSFPFKSARAVWAIKASFAKRALCVGTGLLESHTCAHTDDTEKLHLEHHPSFVSYVERGSGQASRAPLHKQASRYSLLGSRAYLAARLTLCVRDGVRQSQAAETSALVLRYCVALRKQRSTGKSVSGTQPCEDLQGTFTLRSRVCRCSVHKS